MKEGERRNPAEVGYDCHVGKNGESGFEIIASLRH